MKFTSFSSEGIQGAAQLNMHFLQEIWGSATNMLALKTFEVRHAFLHFVIGV